VSLLPFTFEEERHLYTTPGRYTLSTSDVVDLMGLSNMDQIPIAVLRNAAYRGKCLHKAIECYEQNQDWQDDFPNEFMPYLDGWFAFRDAYPIQLVGPHEKPYVYLHEGTDQAIGATIDFRFLYDGDLWIGDLKTIHPLSGKALRQKLLACRLQGESYKCPTEMDEEFIKSCGSFGSIKKAVIHIHPKLKQGYAVHLFPQDDSLLWDSAVRLAMEKVSVGILPSRRNVDVQGALRDSLEAEYA